MTNEAQEKIALCQEKQLPYLDLSSLGLTQIPSELSALVWLERLSLSGNQISDISPLALLTKIHKLSLSNNQISDLTPLSHYERLKFLFIQHNDISDITTLSTLLTLKKIVAHDNHIQNGEKLVSLPQLVYLDIRRNPGSNPNILKKMGTLKLFKG